MFVELLISLGLSTIDGMSITIIGELCESSQNLILLLTKLNGTVTICNKYTSQSQIESMIKDSDILIYHDFNTSEFQIDLETYRYSFNHQKYIIFDTRHSLPDLIDLSKVPAIQLLINSDRFKVTNVRVFLSYLI